jgi:hypothetical protein
MTRLLAALVLPLLVAGLAWADEPQASNQRAIVLLTPPVSAAVTVGCYLTAARNASVSVQVVNGVTAETLASRRQVLEGGALALLPVGRFGFGYCKFTVHAGGRNAIRGSVCAFDGVACDATSDAR